MVEDFKLTTGTFFHVGASRTNATSAATPAVHDALVAGQDRPFIGLLAWPNLHACRQITGNSDASYEEVVRHPAVIACLKQGLQAHNASTTGASSMRIARAMLMVEPPSIDGNNSPTRATSTSAQASNAAPHWSRSFTPIIPAKT